MPVLLTNVHASNAIALILGGILPVVDAVCDCYKTVQTHRAPHDSHHQS